MNWNRSPTSMALPPTNARWCACMFAVRWRKQHNGEDNRAASKDRTSSSTNAASQTLGAPSGEQVQGRWQRGIYSQSHAAWNALREDSSQFDSARQNPQYQY